jgi:hypothetical protein
MIEHYHVDSYSLAARICLGIAALGTALLAVSVVLLP